MLGSTAKDESSNVLLSAKQDSRDKSDSEAEDASSTAYPSKLSSYSTIKDFTSSISSVPRSWTNYSMSSCAVPDLDCDSVTNTSWKDNTYSDLDSVLQSRSSIAPTDSLLFVPRKLKSYSIDESPELLNKESKSPSGVSLEQSDSFEYANSDDKLRIKRMEEMWQKEKEDRGATERAELRRKEQQRKMNEYIQRKLKHMSKNESKDSESEDSADSGKGWTFVKDDAKTLGRNSTVKRHSKDLGRSGLMIKSSKSKENMDAPGLTRLSPRNNTSSLIDQLKNSCPPVSLSTEVHERIQISNKERRRSKP
ncbi:hypothetical protein WA026_014721 [Henosepilachna vigintioctopunctata]|uniref:Uncharacterized protein n=1 Tax=Henosepilachna vigintioctopunctata TaxID=420089 RepID=A0AAW1V838_9CUCU